MTSGTAATGGALPTLLLVHGAWHGAWCWERFVPWLEARGYRVVAPDLRKHGAKTDRAGLRWTRIGEYVEDVSGVLDGLSGPVVVGHSMGGLIAQKVLERRGAAGLALLASVPTGGVLAATPGLPVLVVGGEQDGIFTPEEVRRTARAYGSEAVLFAGSGHDLMLDVGWEEAAARIDGWVRERVTAAAA